MVTNKFGQTFSHTDALLASVFQGNINYCPQSSDVKNFNKLKRDFRMGFLIKDHCATPDVR